MSITRRLDRLEGLFARQGMATSEAAPSSRIIAAAMEEQGTGSHQYIGDMVNGQPDGIVTTFAVASWVAGAGLGAGSILIYSLGLFPHLSRPTVR